MVMSLEAQKPRVASSSEFVTLSKNWPPKEVADGYSLKFRLIYRCSKSRKRTR